MRWRSYPPFYHANTFIIYERILSGKVEFPPFFSEAAKDLVLKLLQADPSKRFGCMQKGVEDIKSHAFFNDIDFGTCALPFSPCPSLAHLQHSSKGDATQRGERAHSQGPRHR